MAQFPFAFDVPSDIPENLPLLALRRGVLLPGSFLPLTVGRSISIAALDASDGLILVGAQRTAVDKPAPSDLLSTATLARVVERKRTRPERIVVQGLARVELKDFPSTTPYIEANHTLVSDAWPDDPDSVGLFEALRDAITDTAELLGGTERVTSLLKQLERESLVVDAVASFLEVEDRDWKREVLETRDPVVRAEKVLHELVKTREVIAAKKAVKDRVETETRDMQRDFVLRQQLDAIKKELGEGGDDDEIGTLKQRLEAKPLSEEARKVVDRELKRLERIGKTSPERSVAIDWLEWIADLPWGSESAVDVDLSSLEDALEESHYGLEDVKRQVVEHLSVRKLAGEGRADVLLLVGPPGVGKTSIGQAIADATGRELVRVALGGVRDEAELRGHRRTYIGARPGRLIEGVRRAGTTDPVILLDEIDKLVRAWNGNPSAALLEILDPEQNSNFVDHYLEVPWDLSKALFIATANDLSTIPAPLRDRMEIIDIAGYTRSEKTVIARRHLLSRVAKNAGLDASDVEVSDAVIEAAIDGWTREAGVRELQRVLGKLYRAAAVKKARGTLDAPLKVELDDLETHIGRRKFFDEDAETDEWPGIARGLAWTPVGGSVLYVEASTLPGNGRLVLTGKLGDVMKESARAALTYVLAHHEALGIDPQILEKNDVHIHVPAGAIPKDGPSAGVTMFTALASLLSGRPVRSDTAMTGEATLRGRVLPVGGIKSKVLAAHRHGIKQVLLPRRNGFDLAEVPDEVKAEMQFILVDHMHDALQHALVPKAGENGASEAA